MSADSLEEALAWSHERVHLVSDPSIGLHGVIAIHSTVLGPALGGLRLWRYERGLIDAFEDALRLSRAMTLKAAAAGLDLGGGKAVILDSERDGRRTDRLKRFAAEVEALGGTYITAEDVGTTTLDMDFLSDYTQHVVGRTERSGIGGDPSPDTARSVLGAIRAAFWALEGSSDLTDRVIGVLGLGKVGAPLAQWLADAGATVLAYDPAEVAIDGIECVGSEAELLERKLDVLAPCALGGVVDDAVASALQCRVICGAANNPLRGEEVARTLAARDILYVPDFLANCGGLVRGDAELRGAGTDEVVRKLEEAEQRTRAILVEARQIGRLPVAVAEHHALARIARAESGEETRIAADNVL